MESANRSAAGQPAAAPTAAAMATGSLLQEVYFEKQVLKLGMDGSKLPRRVVVTDTHIYVCVPTGGITRTIAVRRIEWVTLCPREDVADDDDADSHAGCTETSDSAAAPGGAGSDDPTKPLSTLKREKATSLFTSAFSQSGGIASKKELETPHTSRADVSPASSSHHHSSSTASKVGRKVLTSAAAERSVTVVAIGIAQEPALALQFYSTVDGEDFVAALREASHMPTTAVFNVPNEEGPADVAGRLLPLLPGRCEGPVAPRALKREADGLNVDNHKPHTGDRRGVEKVQLSPPRSPRSPTAPPQPAAHPALLPQERRGSGGSDSSHGKRSRSRESVRTVEPEQAAQPCLGLSDCLLQHRSGDLPPPATSTAACAPDTKAPWHSPLQEPSKSQRLTNGLPLERWTPSPLRAAPHREVPTPPLLKLIHSSPIEDRSGSIFCSRGINAIQSLHDAANETGRALSQERLPDLTDASTTSSAMLKPAPFCPKVAAPVTSQKASNGLWRCRRDSTRVAPASLTPAEVTSCRSLFSGEVNTTQGVDPIPSTLLTAAPQTSSMVTRGGARDAPLDMNALQAELATQSATVAQLQRTLQAHESLLIELANAKADLRGLWATLSERDAQCDRWQAACSQAEERVRVLHRQHECVLAEQKERLQAAHRAELETVQEAFEKYDAKMSAFVEQLQHSHRKEMAQWQHERRTLLFQLNEQQQRDIEVYHRLRAAEVAAQAQYEAQSRCSSAPHVHQHANTHAHQDACRSVKDKLERYNAQRQSSAVVAGAIHSPRDPGTLSRRGPQELSMQHNPVSAGWPLPRATSPSNTMPQLSAHRLLDSDPDMEDEVNQGHPTANYSTAALTQRSRSYIQAHLQTPSPFPLGDGIPSAADTGKGGHTLSRRSYV
ncbi:hypothetical protein MNV84_02568 [Leishmania braziliensis]|nr:hypothetical protein MNV84_02568 [Leishmania braziliensis]